MRSVSINKLGTPVQYDRGAKLYVKREDLCCPGGPNFSKTRGVFAHVAARPEKIIGVLDTGHSQAGWAVARACKALKKDCQLFYPVRRSEMHDEFGAHDLKPQQKAAQKLGATLTNFKAGRSAVLYHSARAYLRGLPFPSYMMPNALKLPETVTETAAEVKRTKLPKVKTVLISVSSGTIAAGVVRGLVEKGWTGVVILHLGYSRSALKVRQYVVNAAGLSDFEMGGVSLDVVDENYLYSDEARPGPTPDFPCNSFYDLKAYRYWMLHRIKSDEPALFWNIG